MSFIDQESLASHIILCHIQLLHICQMLHILRRAIFCVQVRCHLKSIVVIVIQLICENRPIEIDFIEVKQAIAAFRWLLMDDNVILQRNLLDIKINNSLNCLIHFLVLLIRTAAITHMRRNDDRTMLSKLGVNGFTAPKANNWISIYCNDVRLRLYRNQYDSFIH